jgi:hypothetical protein
MDSVGPKQRFDGIDIPKEEIVPDYKVEVDINEGVYE